jgi:hypothetical protein
MEKPFKPKWKAVALIQLPNTTTLKEKWVCFSCKEHCVLLLSLSSPIPETCPDR